MANSLLVATDPRHLRRQLHLCDAARGVRPVEEFVQLLDGLRLPGADLAHPAAASRPVREHPRHVRRRIILLPLRRRLFRRVQFRRHACQRLQARHGAKLLGRL